MHPQSSTATIGVQHPHAKVSTTFVFPLVADFLPVPFFALYFLILAIFQPSFTHFPRLTTSPLFFRCDFLGFGSGIFTDCEKPLGEWAWGEG
jgi:hypothetical protein